MDMSTPTGATGLLAGAISYALAACALIGPDEMTLPTPCPDWDLAALLGHLGDSMADLETAIRTGCLDLDQPRCPAGEDPVEAVRERAAQLLCAAYCYVGPDRFVLIGGLPMPAGLLTCTGAVEIAVHGWDVTTALTRASCDRSEPIPAALATRMLRLCPLIVAGRESLFAVPVEVPAQAAPGDHLVGYLGRYPGRALVGPAAPGRRRGLARHRGAAGRGPRDVR
jgi:uncharacterized protein (TIGR03086 family)